MHQQELSRPIQNSPKPLDLAIRIAESNEDYPKFRLGSVIYKGGRYLSVGWSKLHTHPSAIGDDEESRERVATHAEAHAISMCGDPRNATIYVARIGRNGKLGLSRPCRRCMDLIIQSGIKKVVYTASDSTYEEFRVRRSA